MAQARGHQRMVPFHGTLELFAEDGGPGFPSSPHRDEPLGGDQAQLVAIGLVDQDLRLRGVQGRTHELHVEEVHPHAPGCVLHGAFATAFGVLDTADGREVSVVNREHRIAVLVQGGAHLLDSGDNAGWAAACAVSVESGTASSVTTATSNPT